MWHPRKMFRWIGLQHWNQPRFSWIPTVPLEFSAQATGASRCVLAFFTDCGFLSTEPKLDMVQCAAAHEARGFQDVFPLSHDKIRNGNDLVMYVILFNWFALICYIC